MIEPDKVKQYINFKELVRQGMLCYKALFLCRHRFQKTLKVPTFVHLVQDSLLS